MVTTIRPLFAALFLLAIIGSAWAQRSGSFSVITVNAASTIIPANRLATANWQMAGLQSIGGIPTRSTQCGSTVNPIGGGSNDSTAIDAAITACTAGQFVNLGSGTFTITEGNLIHLNKGVTLRGQGPGVTILNRPTGPGTWVTNNATFQASVATNVMTVLASPAPFGQIICGGANPSIIAGAGGIGGPPAGIPAGTTCSSYGTGTVNLTAGTYNLSTTPGTVASEAMSSTQCSSSGAWGATIGCGIPGNNATPVIRQGSGIPTAHATSAFAVDGVGTNSLPCNAGGTGCSVQLVSTTGFSVGDIVHIDQLGNGGNVADPAFNSGTGQVWASPALDVVWNSHDPTIAFYDSSCLGPVGNEGGINCGTNVWASAPPGGDECAYSIRCGGVQEEDHLVTAVGTSCPGAGCTLTFDTPLTIPYTVANGAQAVDWQISSFTQQAGLENLTVQNGDNGNVVIQGCTSCWSYRVEETNYLNPGFYLGQAAFRYQLDTYWSHNAAWPSPGGAGYSIALTYGVSECLIQNGISMLANKVDVVRASGAGCVVANNYMDDSYIFFALTFPEIGMNGSHLIGSHSMLFEGNYTQNIDDDATHGNSTRLTFYRNYTSGFRAAFTAITGTTVDDANNLPSAPAPVRCFGQNMYSYRMNIVGNICGKSGGMSGWLYQTNASTTSPVVLKLGWNPTSVGGSGPDPNVNVLYPTTPTGIYAAPCIANPADPCTTLATGNFDYLNNAVEWDSRGVGTLPTSLFRNGPPSYLAGYPYPPIDPIAKTTAIPAHDRWVTCVGLSQINAACIFSH